METERKGKPLVEFKSLSNVVLGDAAGFSDEITSLAVGARVAALGTRMGSIFVLEHGVNVIRKISTNNACIHALGLDVAGRFCVSGAGDGRITVWSLGPGSEPWVTEHSQLPILGVALAPDQSEEKLTLCAAGEDGRLVLHQRVMFGGQTVLHAGEGPITEVLWRTSLIAWMNDRGVKVYNVKSGRKVTYVARPSRAKGCLTWLSDDQLAMSWGSLVKIAVLVTTGDLQIAEVRHQFNCGDVTIQGLMPLGRQLAALESDGRRTSLRFSSNSGDLFHAVEVPMSRGAFHSHLHLAAAAPHLPMYLTGPREFLVFQVRDLLEYAVQLLEEKRFDEAIRLANSVGHGIEGLGHIVCIKSLGPDVQEGNYERACQILQRFRYMEPPTWQESLVLFDRAGGLPHIALQLPVPPKETLPKEVYDEALRRLIHYPSALVAVLSYWPLTIFSVNSLQELLRKELPSATPGENPSQEERCRYEALALISEQDDPEMALDLLLALGSSEAFKLLRRQAAGEKFFMARLKRFFQVDHQQSCELAVAFRSAVPVDDVCAALEGETRWKHEYLKLLFAQDEIAGQGYHMQMVELFAEYDPMGLLPFLRASERYPLEEALAVCQRKGLREEVAYLLGRAGRVSDALRILLEEVGDVGRAVEFASETQDPQLWETLVGFVLQHSHLLVPLLDHLDALESKRLRAIGSESQQPQPPPMATPAHVLRLLPSETPLPRIATSVQRVLDSLRLSADLHEACSKISASEMVSQKKACIAKCNRGTATLALHCSLCGGAVSSSGIVIVGRAVLHQQCHSPC